MPVRRLSTEHGKESDARLQARVDANGLHSPGMSHPVLQTSGQAGRWAGTHRLYLFSGRQCRTRVGVRMYMSQLAYKTVAFALILEHDCAAARVPAGFIKRIFQSHRRRCRSREPVPNLSPRTIDPIPFRRRCRPSQTGPATSASPTSAHRKLIQSK